MFCFFQHICITISTCLITISAYLRLVKSMTRHDCYMIVIRLHGNHTAKFARMQSTERSNLNMKLRINYTEKKISKILEHYSKDKAEASQCFSNKY